MRVETSHSVNRQWAVLRALPRWPQSASVATIAESVRDRGFPATRRTIERDLQELSRDLPLRVDDSCRPQQWGWAKDSNFEFMPRLSVSQSLALKIVQKHAAPLMPLSMLEDLQPIFLMADRVLRESGWQDWPERIAVLPPTLPLLPPVLDPDVVADVQTAYARRRVLTMMYKGQGKSAPEPMRVHPLGLLLRGAVPLLVCTIEGRPRIRTLIFMRMSETCVDAVSCEEPKGFDYPAYIASLAIRPRGLIRLHLRFENHAGDFLRETPLSKDQKCKDLAPGLLDVRARVQYDDQLFERILQFGGDVEVLKPVGLRRRVGEELARAAAKYAR
jgi:predicted DNA-binding transcriptional regulator YafY